MCDKSLGLKYEFAYTLLGFYEALYDTCCPYNGKLFIEFFVFLGERKDDIFQNKII